MIVPGTVAKRTAAVLVVAALSACGPNDEHASRERSSAPAVPVGEVFRVDSVQRTSYLEVSGIAGAIREATLSTRLMGSVTAILVHEGDQVRAGQTLLRLDARELAARAEQIEASHASADAVHREAELHAQRMRALFAEDAAPRAQLDAAEAGLERALAGVAAARASAAELGALQAYATLTAPFAGTIVRRMVDPGSFAAPGTPLLALQDVSRLRIAASAPADIAGALQPGTTLTGSIEGVPVSAIVEGVVPAGSGSMYRVNAIVDNAARLLPAGGSATLAVPLGERPMIIIPEAALSRHADLTGVYVRRGGGDVLRWIRTRPFVADSVEVLGGLQAGDEIIIPTTPAVR